jgi:DNA primase
MGQRRINFKAIKEGADFLAILGLTGVAVKRDGAEYVALCPFHHDTRASFRINPEKQGGVFHCFGCGAGGNVLDYVVRKERLTLRQAAERIAEWCALPAGVSDRAPSRGDGASGSDTPPASSPVEKPRAPIAENRALTFSLKLSAEHPFLDTRGLAPMTIAHFGIGYASRGLMAGRIAIPIRNEDGELIAYAGRWANEEIPDGESRYKLPPGFSKTSVLYNLDRVRGAEHVVVVEGYWGVFRLYELGIPAVALMGIALSPRQEALLTESNTKRLSLLLDGDEPGRTAALELLPRLAQHFFVRIVNLPQGSQPDTVSVDDLRRLLEEDPLCPQDSVQTGS